MRWTWGYSSPPYGIIYSMAVPAKKLAMERAKARPPELTNRDQAPPELQVLAKERNQRLRVLAAKLYGRGLSKKEIARAIAPNMAGKLPEIRYAKAYRKISRWEMQDEFRDLVYRHAVVKLDLATPGILRGIAGKAKRGRVDAARLALELTGRHVPKSDGQATQIVLAMGNIPRPVDEAIDSTAVEVEDDAED